MMEPKDYVIALVTRCGALRLWRWYKLPEPVIEVPLPDGLDTFCDPGAVGDTPQKGLPRRYFRRVEDQNIHVLGCFFPMYREE